MSDRTDHREAPPVPTTAGDGHKLRILMVMHMPARRSLGGPRVQLELADELRRLGCDVDIYARDDAFQRMPSTRLGQIAEPPFWRRAIADVSAVANRYDVIDAHQTNLPVSKQRLGFRGLMVARSAGLIPVYMAAEQAARRRWNDVRSGRTLMRPVHALRERRTLRACMRTLRYADLVLVPNAREAAWMRDYLAAGERTAVVHNGIAADRLAELAAQVPDCETRRAQGTVGVLGEWSVRKGARDWADVIGYTRRLVPSARFIFLGTRVASTDVLAELGHPPNVEVVEAFTPDELAAHLGRCTVGALPTYAEGFGLGLLEQLAAGIPAVAYDADGPCETVGAVDKRLLVSMGDRRTLAEQLAWALRLDENAYERLARHSAQVAATFSWRLLAEQTLQCYRDGLRRLRAGGA